MPQICEGEDAVITFSGASTYSWFPSTYLNTTVGSTVTIMPQDTITYTITGQNASGCTDEATFFVDFLPAPTINLSAINSFVCDGDNIMINASGADSYEWYPSASLNSNNGSNVMASPLIATLYTAVGTATNGCKDSSDITISVNPLPVLNVVGSNIICEGQPVSLSVSGANT